MKKKIIILIMSLMSVFLIDSVRADEYTCVYDFSYKIGLFDWLENDAELIFTINKTEKTISSNAKSFFSNKKVYFMDYYVNDKYTNEYIVESLDGGCVGNITVGPIGFEDIFAYALFFEESNFYSLDETAVGYYALPSSIIEKEQILGAITDVAVGELNEEKSTGKKVEAKFDCDYYKTVIDELKTLDCKDKSLNCDLEEIKQYNDKKEKLKNFCKSVTKYSNVGLSYCINACLNLNEDVYKIENIDNISGACGLSGRLIQFIGKVVKWMKYLVPVIVIVLSIIDFIKATGADKEDEIKKAQSKFIRRLIIAALIFIIPFIIEFVLNKMGFDANGCGIIDL